VERSFSPRAFLNVLARSRMLRFERGALCLPTCFPSHLRDALHLQHHGEDPRSLGPCMFAFQDSRIWREYDPHRAELLSPLSLDYQFTNRHEPPPFEQLYRVFLNPHCVALPALLPGVHNLIFARRGFSGPLNEVSPQSSVGKRK